MVIEQYPHYLYVLPESEPTMQPNGDWIATQTTWSLVGRCREETNGKGSEIVTGDFKAYKFSSLIQCPVGTPAIVEGTTIMVTDKPIGTGERIRIKGPCSKFDPGTLHCRLWV